MTTPTDPPIPSNYYLNNAELLQEVKDCIAAKKISDKLAKMLYLITFRYSTKPRFSGYSYIDDMRSEALTDLCKNALKFNPERSSNPFAFYTKCIHHSFFGYMGFERKHSKIRDSLLVEIGENPSYNFQDEYNSSVGEGGDHYQNMSELSTRITEAKERILAEKLYDEKKKAAEDLLKFDDENAEIEEEELLAVESNLTLLDFDEQNK